MANLNKLFSTFNEKITLTQNKKDNLRTGRDALRAKIKENFKDCDRKAPSFCGQGSFMMGTTINQLPGKEYDIDDGVYIEGYSDVKKEEWPTPTTVHNWVKEAVADHTSTPPVDKKTCIRVIYLNDYHIDLPIYIEKDNIIYLSHKRDGWIASDPKAFTDWFFQKLTLSGEQLRRIVKYLKAWRDYIDIDLKSICITVLVANHFYGNSERDEISLQSTLSRIINALDANFTCTKPVAPYEELLNPEEKEPILAALRSLYDNITMAVDEKDEIISADYCREVFGDRFPKGTTSDSTRNYATPRPAVLTSDGRSG